MVIFPRPNLDSAAAYGADAAQSSADGGGAGLSQDSAACDGATRRGWLANGGRLQLCWTPAAVACDAFHDVNPRLLGRGDAGHCRAEDDAGAPSWPAAGDHHYPGAFSWEPEPSNKK